VQIAIPGFYLRRPISICDWETAENGRFDVIYKVVGHGTEALSHLSQGSITDALIGLGNGYDIGEAEEAQGWREPLLVGGGVGTPPLFGLCRRLLAAGKRARVILGFNTKSEVILQREFEALGVDCAVYTLDGSLGMAGVATDGMRKHSGKFDHVFACGPEPMLKAAHAQCEDMGVDGQFSFEERMACGFGVCMGCSCKTRYGSKRICKDGPVLRRGEIIW